MRIEGHRRSVGWNRLLVLPFLLCYFVVESPCGAFGFLISTTIPTKTTEPHKSTLYAKPLVAIVGGNLAGTVAASVIARENMGVEIVLLTSNSKILEGFPKDSSPILPDLTLETRELIERYGNGGRELAGILAKQCTPRQAKEILEEVGVQLQDEATTMSTLLHEKPLFVSPKSDLQQLMEDALETAQVKIQTKINVTKLSETNSGFELDLKSKETLRAHVVVLAGDCRAIPPTPILISKDTSTTKKSGKKKGGSFQFEFDDEEEPMSLKDTMKLEKKRHGDAKKKRIDQLVHAKDINVNELSKQELKTLIKKRKKEKKKQKIKNVHLAEDENNEDVADEPTDWLAFDGLNTISLAEMLGHTAAAESLGCFSFMVPTRGILEGCTKSIVPKARLRCKVENVAQGRAGRLPKVEGPINLSQGEVDGPGALRLSTMIAHEMAHSGNRGTLQIHFAPDVGSVEDLEATLLEVADPGASVLKSPCPLIHREIDYEDYDFETGDFRSVEFPLVPKDLWVNMCREAGITVAKLKWKDLPPNNAKNLARLLVNCPLTITGIRPQENALAGGVNLKEVDMGDCQSRLVQRLFLCGSTIDVHGFDGGFNPLADLATGYVAGANALEAVKKSLKEMA